MRGKHGADWRVLYHIPHRCRGNEDNPDELGLATRRDFNPLQSGATLGPDLKLSTAHYSTCSKSELRMPVVRTLRNPWSCRWW